MTDSITYKGYKGEALNKLKKLGVKVWSDVEIKTTKGVFTGVILPRSETADDKHIVMKMKNGYNIGLATESILEAKEFGFKKILHERR